MKRQYSLRKRIIMICIIPLLIFAFGLFAFYQFYQRSNEEQGKVAFMSLAGACSDRIQSDLDGIRTSALNAGSIIDVQNYLISMSNTQKLQTYSALMYSLDLIRQSTVGCECIFVRSENLACIRSASDYFEYYSALMNDYDMWRNPPAKASFFAGPYNIASRRDSTYYFFVYEMTASFDVRARAAGPSSIVSLTLFDPAKLVSAHSDSDDAAEGLISSDRIIASSRGLSDDTAREILASADGGVYTVSLDGTDYYLNVQALPDYPDFQRYYMYRQEALVGDMQHIWRFSVIAILGAGAMMAILLILMLRWISRPIKLLANDLESVTPETTDVEQTDMMELTGLVDSVRGMLASLKEARQSELSATKRVYRLELQQTRAEMLAYRSQINPHFLFNTLGSMCSQARAYHAPTLEKLIISMAEMFRYALRAPTYVSLEQDIDNAANYMSIMSVRMLDKYSFRVSASEEAKRLSVLSLLLQPLVENSVEHGFRGYQKAAKYTIAVRAFVAEGALNIQVTDNGVGMSEEEAALVVAQMKADMPFGEKHIGLNNLWHRLTLAYGERCRLDIRSAQGYYTQANIVIPKEELERQLPLSDTPRAT